ncbi:346_t:CDS:2 [Gigaspora margarita]|uniref:346_t:CDS:1 n=1 Tax=Gigaspora margarita TaxID=4874 RepID=A0ABM8VX02_GIGMA|nr:346_t:CDS:2 [Gigaspora margarita]
MSHTNDSVSKLDTSINVAVSVADAVKSFLPIVGAITDIANSVIQAYEKAQANKKTCAILVRRVNAAKFSIEELVLQKEQYFKQFCERSYFESFLRFVEVLKNIKVFIDDISQLQNIISFINSTCIEERLKKILYDYDSASADLNLAICIAIHKNTEDDLKIFKEDFEQMSQMLRCINGEVKNISGNVIALLQNNVEIAKSIMRLEKKHESQMSQYIKQIPYTELKEPIELSSRSGKIIKKLYNGMDIYCKMIKNTPTSEKSSTCAQFYLLEKLRGCPNIVNFYGFSKINGSNCLVYEWAEMGNLKEAYEDNYISWPTKISIATSICRGLLYLNACQILHHDIRCENILMTDKWEPKIANFKFAREVDSISINLTEEVKLMIRWLAPEKMRQFFKFQNEPQPKYVPYTTSCEIFSFGMLLWELGSQRIPYEKKEIGELTEHVMRGLRENLNFGLSSPRVDQKYVEIIRSAWEHHVDLRIELPELLKELCFLNKKLNVPSHSPGIHPKELNRDNLNISDQKLPDVPNYTTLENENVLVDALTFDHLSIGAIATLEEGINAYNEKKFDLAWKCFNYYAKIGIPLAKYWKGVCLWEGHPKIQDKLEATKLFHEAADERIVDTQLRYAFALIDEDVKLMDQVNFKTYIEMAADNQEPTAIYTLGKMYYYGKYVQEDKTKGIDYLKLAALKGQNNANKLLEDLKIDIY